MIKTEIFFLLIMKKPTTALQLLKNKITLIIIYEAFKFSGRYYVAGRILEHSQFMKKL